jgi:hypothetical protein
MTHEKNGLLALLNLPDYFQEFLSASLVNALIEAQVGPKLGGFHYNIRSLSCSNCGRAQHKVGNYFLSFEKGAHGLGGPSTASVQGALNVDQGFVFPTRLGVA